MQPADPKPNRALGFAGLPEPTRREDKLPGLAFLPRGPRRAFCCCCVSAGCSLRPTWTCLHCLSSEAKTLFSKTVRCHTWQGEAPVSAERSLCPRTRRPTRRRRPQVPRLRALLSRQPAPSPPSPDVVSQSSAGRLPFHPAAVPHGSRHRQTHAGGARGKGGPLLSHCF